MLKAGTDLSSFTNEELINIDAKKVILGSNVNAKIAQVNTADISDVMVKKAEIENALQEEVNKLNLDLNILLITDIINSNSQVIALGTKSDLIEKAYNVKLENNTALLRGIVSRKKQVIPVITSAITD